MAGLRLYLLGTPRLERDGLPTRIQRRKVLALLAYLAVAGQPQRRDSLAALFWPGIGQSQARAALTRHLSELRKALNRESLHADRETVTLTLWHDVQQFRHCLQESAAAGSDAEAGLGEAIQLYHGDFLSGFSLSDCPEFDEWQLFQTEALRHQLAVALEGLVQVQVWRGAVAEALPSARRRVGLDPLHEPAQRQLMRLYAQSGQPAAALRQYERCARMLHTELGLAPAAETTALYEQIRQGQPVDSPAPESPFPAGITGAGPPVIGPPAFLRAPVENRGTPAPFVARQEELSRLHDWLDSVRPGQGRSTQGRVVFLAGEAGQGKTALAQTFARQAQARLPDLIVALGDCTALVGPGDPYQPFRGLLDMLCGAIQDRWVAGVISEATARRLWSRAPWTIQTLLETGPDLLEVFVPATTLLKQATAVSRDVHGDQVNAWLEAVRRTVADRGLGAGPTGVSQADLFGQFTRVLQRLSSAGPVLLVLDDLQWADPASINLLFHLGRHLDGYPILILGLYRPADVFMGGALMRAGPWERHPLAPVINEFQRLFGPNQLDLAQADGRRFVGDWLDTAPHRLSPAYETALFARTGGHPLFTIEIVRDMQARGDLAQDGAGRWIETGAIDWDRLPARVEGVIRERLARLPAATRRLLRVAAVEGERFTAEVVAQVLEADAAQIRRLLRPLLDQPHNLVRDRGVGRIGSAQVSRQAFRHALFQSYLYHELSPAERVYLHERVGLALERLYGGQIEDVVSQLAGHFEAAGLVPQAVTYLKRAGDAAVRVIDYDGAIAYYERALALLDARPQSSERDSLELPLQVALGSAMTFTVGPTAARTRQTNQRALALGRQLAQPSQCWPPLYGLWLANFIGRGPHRRGRELAEELLHLARDLDDPEPQLVAHRLLGTTLFYLGEADSGVEHLAQALVHYDPGQHRDLVYRYSHDPGVMSLAYLALCLWWLGRVDQALDRSQAALDLARQLSHPLTGGLALLLAAILHQLIGDPKRVRELAQELLSQAAAHQLPTFVPLAYLLEGWALVRLGKVGRGQSRLRQGAAEVLRRQGTIRLSYLPMMAEGYLAAGQIEAGLAAIDEALAIVNQTGERWCESTLYRLRGDLLAAEPDRRPEAERNLRRALDIATLQGAKSFQQQARARLNRLAEGG